MEWAAFERHLNSRVSNRKLRPEVYCAAVLEEADRLELLERLVRETEKPLLFDRSFCAKGDQWNRPWPLRPMFLRPYR
jgi:hypothetical protein